MENLSCSICNQTISYDIHDESTYASIEENQNRMLGKLFTMRIYHKVDSQYHHNVVVTDAKGKYRAHKDAYSENVRESDDDFDKLQEIYELLPMELIHYTPLADNEARKLLLHHFQGKNDTPTPYWIFQQLEELYRNNRENPFISFIFGKWAFITGDSTYYEDILAVSVENWLFPTAMRLKGRQKPSPELLDELDEFDWGEKSILEAEYAVAYAEIGLRSGAKERIEELFQKYNDLWDASPDVFLTISLNFIKAYYGYNIYLQGTFQKGLDLIRPAYIFSQMIQHRSLNIVVGNFYGAVLKNIGELEEATRIYDYILKIAQELSDERSELMVLSNIGAIEFQRGKVEKAIDVFTMLYEAPASENHLVFKLSAIINKCWALQQVGRDEEAFVLLQEALAMDNLSFSFLIAIYSTFLRSVRNTRNIDLLKLLEEQVQHEKLIDVPSGQIVLFDIAATRALLEGDWVAMEKNLLYALAIMRENDQYELILSTELQLAESYFNHYIEDRSQIHLNKCYRHLDLIRSLATDQGYYPMLYRVTVLKGLIAKEVNYIERAKNLFLKAEQYVNKYNLFAFKDEIKQLIQNVDTQSQQEEYDTGSLFKQIQRIAQRIISRGPSSQSHKIKGLIISAKNADWKWGGYGKKYELDAYLRGISDIWNVSQEFIVSKGVTRFSGFNGEIFVESSENFFLLAIAKSESYEMRIELEGILHQLEEFELINNIEEREEFLHDKIKSKIDEFIKL